MEQLLCKDCIMASKLVAEPWTGIIHSPAELHTCVDMLSVNFDGILREEEPACRRFGNKSQVRPGTI